MQERKGFFVVLLSLLLLAACSEPKPPIKVGLASNLTGRASDAGIEVRNGVQLAVEEINAAGGVKGRTLELLIKDDEGKADSAKRVFQELLAARVDVVIGHVISGMTQAVLPLANEKKMLLLTPTSVSSVFTGKDDYLIRTSPANQVAIAGLAQYGRQPLGLEKMSVIYDLSNKGYSEEWSRTFKESFEQAEGKLLALHTYATGPENDFSALATAVLANSPDGVAIAAGAVDAALLAQQLRKQRADLPILIAGWAVTDELLVKGGKAIEGAYMHYNFDRDSQNPAYLAFKERYQKRFGSVPGFGAKYGYETVGLLKVGIEKAATLDSDALKRAIIAQGNFTGLQGDFRIDAFGDADVRALIFTVKDGAFRRVQ